MSILRQRIPYFHDNEKSPADVSILNWSGKKGHILREGILRKSVKIHTLPISYFWTCLLKFMPVSFKSFIFLKNLTRNFWTPDPPPPPPLSKCPCFCCSFPGMPSRNATRSSFSCPVALPISELQQNTSNWTNLIWFDYKLLLSFTPNIQPNNLRKTRFKIWRTLLGLFQSWLVSFISSGLFSRHYSKLGLNLITK